jgi:hypothetical protein
VASIHAPPRYQPGALPNELTQRFDRGALARNQTPLCRLQGGCIVDNASRAVEPAGGIKPASHPYEGRVLSLNYAGIRFSNENLQTDGHSASHPEGGSCTMPRPIVFGRSRCKTARSLRIAFQTSGTAQPCAVRVRTRLSRSRQRGSCARTSCAQHKRCFDYSGLSCDDLGLFCPPAIVGGGVFWPCRRLFGSS